MAWYNASWSNRVKVTVLASKVDADLTDYPVFVNLANLPADFHSKCNQTDARDIRVTTSDGITERPREVVYYTAASDAGELHFKGDVDSDTDTDFYIYYGNAAAADYAHTDEFGTHNVWNANYKAVYHLDGNAYATCIDSTSNGYDFTGETNTPAYQSAGQVGRSVYLDGTENLKRAGIPAITKAASFTVSFWAKADATVANRNPFQNKVSVSDFTDTTGMMVGSNVMAVGIYTGSAYTYKKSGAYTSTDWERISIIYTLDTSIALIFDATAQTGTGNPYLGNTTGPLFYLGSKITGDQLWLGYLDEFRVSDIARTTTWESTEFNNTSSPSTFYNVGTAESGSLIAKVSGVAKASIAKTTGVAIASVGKISGLA